MLKFTQKTDKLITSTTLVLFSSLVGIGMTNAFVEQNYSAFLGLLTFSFVLVVHPIATWFSYGRTIFGVNPHISDYARAIYRDWVNGGQFIVHVSGHKYDQSQWPLIPQYELVYNDDIVMRHCQVPYQYITGVPKENISVHAIKSGVFTKADVDNEILTRRHGDPKNSVAKFRNYSIGFDSIEQLFMNQQVSIVTKQLVKQAKELESQMKKEKLKLTRNQFMMYRKLKQENDTQPN